MKNQSRHSGVGRNPVVLLNTPLDFAFAAQRNFLINWIPAYDGMTEDKVTA